MGKTKLDETYIFEISIKMRFFWCSYWYQNFLYHFLTFGYYWAGSLLTTVRYHELFEKKIIRYFGASDIIIPLRKYGSKLEKDYIFSLGPFHLLFRLFSR